MQVSSLIRKKIIRKWHIQREDSPKQEEIKEERTTRQKFLSWRKTLHPASFTFITERTGMKANYTTEAK